MAMSVISAAWIPMPPRSLIRPQTSRRRSFTKMMIEESSSLTRMLPFMISSLLQTTKEASSSNGSRNVRRSSSLLVQKPPLLLRQVTESPNSVGKSPNSVGKSPNSVRCPVDRRYRRGQSGAPVITLSDPSQTNIITAKFLRGVQRNSIGRKRKPCLEEECGVLCHERLEPIIIIRCICTPTSVSSKG
jgi:hypothetical protein